MKIQLDLKFYGTLMVVLFVMMLTMFALVSLLSFRDKTAERQVEDIANIVRSAAIQCYALEGSYPPDIYYLADHYGLILDEEEYIYYYAVYGANVMPDIQVLRKEP